MWHLLHTGRITSSRFGEIHHRRDSTNPDSMVATLMGYKPQLEVLPPAIRWGCDNEPLARKAYVASMKERGCDVQVSDCGLHLHYKYSYLGASSDGVVVDHSLDDVCCRCLEVKCPFSMGTPFRWAFRCAYVTNGHHQEVSFPVFLGTGW